jgi:hypothetical protein
MMCILLQSDEGQAVFWLTIQMPAEYRIINSPPTLLLARFIDPGEISSLIDYNCSRLLLFKHKAEILNT